MYVRFFSPFVALFWTCSSKSTLSKLPSSYSKLPSSLVVGSLLVDTALQMLTHAEQWGKIASFSLLVMLFLMQSRMLLAFLAARDHCWFMVSLVYTKGCTKGGRQIVASVEKQDLTHSMTDITNVVPSSSLYR